MLLQIRRPNNYDHSIAETLGPTDYNPTINLDGLDIVRTVVNDSPDKLFIGGLPCEWKEDEVGPTCAQHTPCQTPCAAVHLCT